MFQFDVLLCTDYQVLDEENVKTFPFTWNVLQSLTHVVDVEPHFVPSSFELVLHSNHRALRRPLIADHHVGHVGVFH